MADVTYVSKVRIVRQRGPARLAYLPAEKEPVPFGVHGAPSPRTMAYRRMSPTRMRRRSTTSSPPPPAD